MSKPINENIRDVRIEDENGVHADPRDTMSNKADAACGNTGLATVGSKGLNSVPDGAIFG